MRKIIADIRLYMHCVLIWSITICPENYLLHNENQNTISPAHILLQYIFLLSSKL